MTDDVTESLVRLWFQTLLGKVYCSECIARDLKVKSVVLLALLLAGCGLVTMNARPDPPPHTRPIDAEAEWKEIKDSRAATRTGMLVLVVRPTPPAGTSMIATATIRLMPYADGIQEELATLLRWRYDGGLYYPTKVSDAPEHINESLARYRRALAEANLEDLFHDLDLTLNQPVRLTLAGGDYLALSEYRTQGRGPTYKVWVWLRRVSVKSGRTVDVALDDDNRLCFESWAPSGTSCRGQSSLRLPAPLLSPAVTRACASSYRLDLRHPSFTASASVT